MDDSYLFIVLLSLTVATVAGVLVQVLFGLLEVKKRRLQERLGAAPESNFESVYGPIANAEKAADLTGMLARSPMVMAFHAKLARAYPGVVLQKFLFMIVGFAGMAGVLGFIGTRSLMAGLFAGAIAGMLPFLIVSSRCAKHQK